MTTVTTLADVHPDIIQTHILPRLAGVSPSTTAATTATTNISSYLLALCSDDDLWADISKSTWPSISNPRVDDIITTFDAGHRSFFEDSLPLLITDVNHSNHRSCYLNLSSHLLPSEVIISAVDMRYQNEILHSTVEFTDTRTDHFLSSTLAIELNKEPSSNASGIALSIGSKAGDIINVTNEATLSHLKESVTLNWIIINPKSKRAGNLSSIKPVSVRPGWMPNQTVLRYKTVLPGCDPNEMVECRIEVVLGGVGDGDEGLHVQEVVLKLLDMDSVCLNGREFLVITQGAILEENNVRRKVVDDEGRLRSYKEYKRLKRGKLERAKKKKDKLKYIVGIWCVFSFLFLSLCC